LVGLVSDSGEKWWHLLLPGLGQQVVMTRVLKGEALMSNHIVLPALVCVVVTVLCVMYITRELRQAAVR
jgi:cell division protein FtsL